MPDDSPPNSPRRHFHTLRETATELGLSYKRVRALAANGYFGELTRTGDAGQGPYLVPEAVLQRLRNGERVAS